MWEPVKLLRNYGPLKCDAHKLSGFMNLVLLRKEWTAVFWHGNFSSICFLMLSTRLAQNTGYALSHQTSDHFLNKTKQKHIIDMFMLLNTAAIGMVYAIVSPCKLGPIDGRIKNFNFSSWDLPTGEKHIFTIHLRLVEYK